MDQEPIPPQPEPVISPPTPPVRKFNPILISAAVVLLLAVGAGGLLLGKSLNNSQPSVRPTATPLPTQIPTPDETANWKTYTNNKLNYSIKIPRDWLIDDKENVFIRTSGEAIFLPQSEKDKGVFSTKIAITKLTNEKIRYSLNTETQFNEWLLMPAATDVRRLAKVENLKIDNLDAVKFISTTLPGDATEPFFSIVTWFRKNGSNYYIEFGGDEKIVNGNVNIYNQILSTFKFLD